MGRLTVSYISWHYGKAFADIATHAKNGYWFLYHFFSIALLTKTFFRPWKRMDADEQALLSGVKSGWFERFIMNTLMRLVGAVVRLCVIVAGVFSMALWSLIIVAVVFIWIFWPIFIAAFIARGVVYMYRGS